MSPVPDLRRATFTPLLRAYRNTFPNPSHLTLSPVEARRFPLPAAQRGERARERGCLSKHQAGLERAFSPRPSPPFRMEEREATACLFWPRVMLAVHDFWSEKLEPVFSWFCVMLLDASMLRLYSY